MPPRITPAAALLCLLACAGPEAAVPSTGDAAPISPAPPAGTAPTAASLGRALFWDPILSGNRDIACATCHHPAFAWADGRPRSAGTLGRGLGPSRVASATHVTTRNAPTVLDTRFNGQTAANPTPNPLFAPMFWDNRAQSLEAQALGPITALAEMRGDSFDEKTILPELVRRLSEMPEYVAQFDAVYGKGALHEDTLAASLAAFERTLVTTGSTFERGALTASQQRGRNIFNSHGCAGCHSGPRFSDFKLHRLGVADAPGLAHDAGDGSDRFRTPSLINVTRTAPYMHNGTRGTLDAVYDFYRTVDRTLDPALANVQAPRPEERADLTAFLQALSDGSFDTTVPASVPSGLPPGGN